MSLLALASLAALLGPVVWSSTRSHTRLPQRSPRWGEEGPAWSSLVKPTDFHQWVLHFWHALGASPKQLQPWSLWKVFIVWKFVASLAVSAWVVGHCSWELELWAKNSRSPTMDQTTPLLTDFPWASFSKLLANSCQIGPQLFSKVACLRGRQVWLEILPCLLSWAFQPQQKKVNYGCLVSY